MGLFSFLGVGSRPAPTPTPATQSATTTPAAETSRAPTTPVAVTDSFEAASSEAPMCSLDGSGPNACFPEFAREGSGGGGKSGGAVDLG